MNALLMPQYEYSVPPLDFSTEQFFSGQINTKLDNLIKKQYNRRNVHHFHIQRG